MNHMPMIHAHYVLHHVYIGFETAMNTKTVILSALLMLSASACELRIDHGHERRPITPTVRRIVRINLIDLYSKANHVPALLTRAVIKVESNGNSEATRFERGQLKACKNDKACATSYGLGQVMGFHAKSLKINPKELLNPETNIFLTTKLLGKCYEKSRELHAISRCYNGPQSPQSYTKTLAKTIIELAEKTHN